MRQVQQGQTGSAVNFATPAEYLITPEVGDCTYDEKSATTKTDTAASFQKNTYERHAGGVAPIRFSQSATVGAEAGIPGIGTASGSTTAGYETTFSSLVGNSEETNSAQSSFAKGLTSSYTESLKRAYYRAALVLTELRDDSFTENFRIAVNSLTDTLLTSANDTEKQAATRTFIFEWGNMIIDTVRAHPCLTIDPPRPRTDRLLCLSVPGNPRRDAV